ncbi:hypothetical protein SS50377_24899 [Spironucleus salmonicida]|nr:hypothetical protein SS50377_24899 [Spironucleus salmonicida]
MEQQCRLEIDSNIKINNIEKIVAQEVQSKVDIQTLFDNNHSQMQEHIQNLGQNSELKLDTMQLSFQNNIAELQEQNKSIRERDQLLQKQALLNYKKQQQKALTQQEKNFNQRMQHISSEQETTLNNMHQSMNSQILQIQQQQDIMQIQYQAQISQIVTKQDAMQQNSDHQISALKSQLQEYQEYNQKLQQIVTQQQSQLSSFEKKTLQSLSNQEILLTTLTQDANNALIAAKTDLINNIETVQQAFSHQYNELNTIIQTNQQDIATLNSQMAQANDILSLNQAQTDTHKQSISELEINLLKTNEYIQTQIQLRDQNQLTQNSLNNAFEISLYSMENVQNAQKLTLQDNFKALDYIQQKQSDLAASSVFLGSNSKLFNEYMVKNGQELRGLEERMEFNEKLNQLNKQKAEQFSGQMLENEPILTELTFDVKKIKTNFSDWKDRIEGVESQLEIGISEIKGEMGSLQVQLEGVKKRRGREDSNVGEQ